MWRVVPTCFRAVSVGLPLDIYGLDASLLTLLTSGDGGDWQIEEGDWCSKEGMLILATKVIPHALECGRCL